MNKHGIRTFFPHSLLMLILTLLNESGIYTLFPGWPYSYCSQKIITVAEQTWVGYTLSWLYSCCSYYCWWTNLAYVHFILTVQLLLILLLVNKLGICTLYPHCTVIVPTDIAERTWHMYTFSDCTVIAHIYTAGQAWHLYTFSSIRNGLGVCTLFPDCTVIASTDAAEQTWHIHVHLFLTDRTATAHSNAGEQTDWHM